MSVDTFSEFSASTSASNIAINTRKHQPGPDYVVDGKIFPKGIHINLNNKGTMNMSNCKIGVDGLEIDQYDVKTQELLGDEFALPYGAKWSNLSYFPDDNGELLEIKTDSPALVWGDSLEVYNEEKHGNHQESNDLDHITFESE